MFLQIKRIIKEFRIIYAFILGILFPINYYLLRKSLNFPIINLLYKTEFSSSIKWWFSSVTLKDKKFTSYRLTPRYFLYYKGYLETSLTSVKFISNNKKKTFNYAEDPKLFVYKNKILLYFQKRHRFRRDCEIFLYDPNSNKTYKINSPFNFNGKNWVPISGLNSLIFVYSIDPLIILKVVDLNKGKMKAITKVKKGFNPAWHVQDIDSSFVGRVRGGSPMVKVGNNRYLGIGHSSTYLFKTFKVLGSSQRAYIYFFDFKKKIYYINYLTNNKIGHLYCVGAELTNKNNIIKFYFNFSSPLVEYLVSRIYIFDIELDKRELIKIAKKGQKKKINLTSNLKI